MWLVVKGASTDKTGVSESRLRNPDAIGAAVALLGIGLASFIHLPNGGGAWSAALGSIVPVTYAVRAARVERVERWILRVIFASWTALYLWVAFNWNTSSTGAVALFLVPAYGLAAIALVAGLARVVRSVRPSASQG
jgi:hypothetical protein